MTYSSLISLFYILDKSNVPLQIQNLQKLCQAMLFVKSNDLIPADPLCIYKCAQGFK